MSTLQDVTLGFVGAGVMAEVMIRGLLEEGLVRPDRIVASDRRAERLQTLHAEHGIVPLGDNPAVIDAADLVVLAVKPQNLPAVLPELRGRLRPETVVVSIIAGASLDRLRDGLGHDRVARCMPNLPCRIRRGMTVWMPARGCDAADRARVAAVLRVMGETARVSDEADVDRATAVSGTGPAIVAEFVKAMMEAAVYVGESRSLAHDTVLATVIGTAEMIRRAEGDGVHTARLIDEVTSPGGTTTRALQVLKQGQFQATLTDAIDAAYRRTRELGEG